MRGNIRIMKRERNKLTNKESKNKRENLVDINLRK